MYCEWCSQELGNEWLEYKGKKFCRRNDDKCIKEYLFEHIEGITLEQKVDNYPEDLMMERSPWRNGIL